MIHSSMASPLQCSKHTAEAVGAVLFPQRGAGPPQKHNVEGTHSYLTLLALGRARSHKGATVSTNKRLLLTGSIRPQIHERSVGKAECLQGGWLVRGRGNQVSSNDVGKGFIHKHMCKFSHMLLSKINVEATIVFSKLSRKILYF